MRKLKENPRESILSPWKPQTVTNATAGFRKVKVVLKYWTAENLAISL